eukprot:scaffold4_cov396-Prasinococcus_capsulatus_cf.AAC.22
MPIAEETPSYQAINKATFRMQLKAVTDTCVARLLITIQPPHPTIILNCAKAMHSSALAIRLADTRDAESRYCILHMVEGTALP